jgi:prepilin signal peptidase PulO-like enzyme (type II secretory pathway)
MILFYLISFLFGLIIGSFLNCLIYRLAFKMSLFSRSICPKCQEKIAWYDNIPVLSYLILKGRCRKCNQKISLEYPIVELVTGFLFFLVFLSNFNQFKFLNFYFFISLLKDWLMIFVLIFIFVYDLKYFLVEDVVLLPILGVIFLLNLFLKVSFFKLLFGCLFGFSFFLIQYLVTKGKGIGLGDLRIGALMGSYFAWPKILIGLFFAYSIGSIFSLFLIIFRKKTFSSKIPLGPFLAIGSLITIFYGDLILNWYERLYHY